MWQEWMAGALAAAALIGSSTADMFSKKPRPPKERATTTERVISGVDAACVAAAVATREAALGSGIGANGTAISEAYAARATALASAYVSTTRPKAIKRSVKSAWDTFGAAQRLAKKSWQTSREAAWKQFRTDVKACKGASEVSDEANVTLESKGE